MITEAKRKVVFIVGATATGKSEWALQLAEKHQGVIVNCDSVQLYKKLEIGAAKPTAEERARVPHYLLDYVPPPNEITAGQYCRDFFECVDGLPPEKPIFVVGGTGFYFMAIEKGMYPVLPIPAEIQKAIAEEFLVPGGGARLYQELLTKDPEYGSKIHVADHYRIGRALEMIRTHGKTVSQIKQEFSERQRPFPFPLLKLGPAWQREHLNQRIFLRSQKMLNDGLIDEVQALLDEGWGSWGPLSSVGYREVCEFLSSSNKLRDKSRLAEDIAVSTRQLAKKQRTWFQRDPEIHWFDGATGASSMHLLVEKFISS